MSSELSSEVWLHIVRCRCEHPHHYDFLPLDGPQPLDVAYCSHPREWVPCELLRTSAGKYTMASLYSWECVTVLSIDALRHSVLTALNRSEKLLDGVEPKLPREIIRCLDLSFDERPTTDVQVLPDLGRILGLTNIDTLVLSHPTTLRLFYDEPPSPTLPLPFSSPFPSSLRVILLTCTDHGVTMKDILLLSAMVPHLERLQVAEFLVDGSLNAVTTGSDILQGLKWLSVGGFQHSPIRINTQDRTPPSRPSASLRSLLDGLSVGSGMPSLRRLDILTDSEIPNRFLDVHSKFIETLSIPGAHHECVNAADTFQRFTSLHQLIILTGPTPSHLPRSGNPSVAQISVIRPPPPTSVGPLPNHIVITQLDTLLQEVFTIAPTCPGLRHVQFFPPHNEEWAASASQRIRLASSEISFSF
ncbi:hypothetical protein D9611_008085 [Ephemerocybe angulata]|uniref:Uncharacterized protein n=1 Tax=Ephemerocybe angulata TaxID=980116 RepID=A0A8H5BZ82_9AGAR|nr:hypothetical protein D9611_008085 [Tulosesus angulatus]